MDDNLIHLFRTDYIFQVILTTSLYGKMKPVYS